MAEFKQNYFQRRTKDRGPRTNNRINSSEVQVIASDGENLGILNTNKAKQDSFTENPNPSSESKDLPAEDDLPF